MTYCLRRPRQLSGWSSELLAVELLWKVSPGAFDPANPIPALPAHVEVRSSCFVANIVAAHVNDSALWTVTRGGLNLLYLDAYNDVGPDALAGVLGEGRQGGPIEVFADGKVIWRAP